MRNAKNRVRRLAALLVCGALGLLIGTASVPAGAEGESGKLLLLPDSSGSMQEKVGDGKTVGGADRVRQPQGSEAGAREVHAVRETPIAYSLEQAAKDLECSLDRLSTRAFRPFALSGKQVAGADSPEDAPAIGPGDWIDELPAKG